MRRALYWRPDGDRIACGLCPRRCVIAPGQSGRCRTRRNYDGVLYAANYGDYTALALDPVEKKPLYHFNPGASVLSVGTWGCNFSCEFCQNWSISQAKPAARRLSPDELVRTALTAARNIGVAFTYSEPMVWYEYVLDAAREIRRAGRRNILLTNGFVNEAPLMKLLPHIDALNIDVKAFQDAFYRRVCGGSLAEVKRTVERAAAHCHVEVTTLVIPGLNDAAAEIAALARWLAGIKPDLPLHLSRYFPQYRMDRPATPLAAMRELRRQAGAFLPYVYLGNMNGASDTHCPQCGALLIRRTVKNSRVLLTEDKKCAACGQAVPIAGSIRYLVNEQE